MSSSLEASVFMGENYSDNSHSIKNTQEKLNLKKMFEISEQLILEKSDEIFGVSQISWQDSPWKQLSFGRWWSHQSLACKGLRILRFYLVPWKDKSKPNIEFCLGTTVGFCSKIHHTTEHWTQSTENWWNSSGIFSQDSSHCSSSKKCESSWAKWANPNNSQDELSWCRCSMTWCGEINTMKKNVLLIPQLCLCAKRFSPGRWLFRLGSEKKWYSIYDSRPQGEWNRVTELMMIKFGESGHPVFRVTSPLFRGTLSKGGGKLSIHFCADGDAIETVFRTIISVNQLSICGAVSELCEEYSICQTSTKRLVVAGRSDSLFVPTSVMKTPKDTKLIDNDTHIFGWDSCTRKFDAEAQRTRGKISTTRQWQKHIDEFLQFAEPMTCREYTLSRDEKSTDPKGWIQGNTKIGPVLQVTTSYLQGEYGVEIRIESVTKDNSSLVGQSFSSLEQVGHRLDRQRVRRQRAGNLHNKYGSIFVCKPIQGLSKTKKRRPWTACSFQRPYLFFDRIWIVFDSNRSSLPSGKKIKHSSSARRITSRKRWSDRILEIERWSSGQFLSILNIGLMMYGRTRWRRHQ